MSKVFLIIVFFSAIIFCNGQNLIIEPGKEVDSMELKNLFKIKDYVADSNFIFLNGIIRKLEQTKYANTSYENLNFLYFDSINEKNPIIRFSFFYTSIKDTSLKFEVDGVTFENQIYINRDKYCLMKYGFSNHAQNYLNTVKQKNKVIDSISKWKRAVIYDTSLSNLNVYTFKIKGYLPKSSYTLDIYLNPKIFIEGAKTSNNSLISRDAYAPLNKCDCEKVEPVILIMDPIDKEERKRAKYDISHSYPYMLIRISDLKIIEFGEFSYENGVYYQLTNEYKHRRIYRFKND